MNHLSNLMQLTYVTSAHTSTRNSYWRFMQPGSWTAIQITTLSNKMIMTMTIPKLKTHSYSYSLRILLSLLAPRRDEIVPALYPGVSLSMKIGAQKKAGRGQRSKPSVCTLPMVPCCSSSVTRVSHSPLPCEKLSA